MEVRDRIKVVREKVKLSQRDFSARINIAQGTLAQFETGVRNIKDIHIAAICREFNVNEHWLRTGEGEIFISSKVFSLDEYAEKKGVSDLDLVLIKSYLDMPKEMRNIFMSHLKDAFIAKQEELSTQNGQEIEKIKKSVPDIRLENELAATLEKENPYDPFEDEEVHAFIRERIRKNSKTSSASNYDKEWEEELKEHMEKAAEIAKEQFIAEKRQELRVLFVKRFGVG